MSRRKADAKALSDEIMTLKEIAGYLKVSEKTIFRMVQSGDLPGVKISNQWRFVRSVIDNWLDARMYGAPRKELLNVIHTAPQVIAFTRLITPRRMAMDLTPGSPREILEQLVDLLARTVAVESRRVLVDELVAREDVVSTAIGHGVAFPHVREPRILPVEVPCTVLGVCRAGTDFGALDGGKTYVFAMPCAGSEVAHLQLMAKLSLLFRKSGVLKGMKTAGTKEEIMEILAKADGEMFGGSAAK